MVTERRIVVAADADLDELVATIGDGRGTTLVASSAAAVPTAVTAASRTGARAVDAAGDPLEAEDDTALDDLHAADPDPWGVDSRFYEQRKRDLLLAALPRPRFARAVEIGSSTGALAAALAPRCDHLLALDSSAAAVAAARERLDGSEHVTVERRALPREWPAGRYDLVVVSEVGYFLSPAALDELIELVRRDLTDDGVLVLCHWRHEVVGWPLDGPAVHAHVVAAGVRPVLATYVDRDIELLVLARPDELPDPAGG